MSGVLDRFSQIEPKVTDDLMRNAVTIAFLSFQVIFSVEAVSYNMKTHEHLGKLGQV